MMLVSRMLRDVRNGNADGFMQKLEALFAKTSYQIQGDSEKDYARPFADDPRKLFKIGVRFSTDSHRIDDWKVVE